jgi:hypothetical protein
MAFKPAAKANAPTRDSDEPVNLPVPRAGNRRARVSLIIDLGTQEREPVYKNAAGQLVDEDTEGAVRHDQKDCQQVAVFADLVNDRVDYGGDIGEKQYRMLLNKSFAGKLQGINFTVGPPKDAKGKIIEGKPWGFHPQNLLTKLAKAVEMEYVTLDVRGDARSLDISLLLNQPFLANVDVKVTEKEKDGKTVTYKNVHYKGASPVPLDKNDNPEDVDELDAKPLCITFDNATKEDIMFIRKGIRNQIKLAKNYPGSAMQAAIEAFEADQGDDAPEPAKAAPTPAPKPAAKTAAKAKAPAPAPLAPEDDVDAPF